MSQIQPDATAVAWGTPVTVEVMPPAGQGDLFRAALTQPAVIGLIDGRFDQVDAVSHKEILWAMTQGIHVFGAASMASAA